MLIPVALKYIIVVHVLYQIGASYEANDSLVLSVWQGTGKLSLPVELRRSALIVPLPPPVVVFFLAEAGEAG